MDSDATYFPGSIVDDLRSDRSAAAEQCAAGVGQAHPKITSPPVASDSCFASRDPSRADAPSDEILLVQLDKGDKEALAILFRRYARMVRAVAYRILRDLSEADDLLQEVFLFIFRKSALFDATRGSARSWIVQVTYHRAIDRRRYLASRHFYTSIEIDADVHLHKFQVEIAFYEQSMEGMLGKEMLRRIHESLSDDQRQIIQLYFFEGYTLEEIASKLGQALGNVRNHYYRGLERMRKQIFSSKLRSK